MNIGLVCLIERKLISLYCSMLHLFRSNINISQSKIT
jgi:hypothetical protein